MKTGYFFDIDGTLYSHAFHEVQASTIEALNYLKELGHKVIAATSRASSEWNHLPSSLRNFPFDARIMDGGPLIYEKENVIKETPIDSSLVKKISTLCKQENMCWKYSTREGTYWGNERVTDPMRWVCWHCYLTLPRFKPYENEAVYNMIVYFDREEQEKNFKDLVKDCSVVPYFDCIEIRANACDKKDSIAYLKDYYSLNRIVCFGDGDNDIDMLAHADLGVAMGNGQKRCKEVADVVIGSCREDAIYQFIMEELK